MLFVIILKDSAMNNVIRICEMFYSLEGETVTAGFPAFFIRLGGCNLDCYYCDTELAHVYHNDMTVKEIVEEAGRNVPFHHITVTGGEPLMQSNTIYLLRELAEKGYNVQLETNGSFSLAEVPQQIRIIADVKTPCSGEAGSFFIENVKYLKEDDEVKFVISDMADYEFSRNFIKEHLEDTGAVINFSPVHGSMEPSELAKLIIRERLNVRLNLQLHKVVGFD